MDTKEFIANYDRYVSEIRSVIRGRFWPAFDKLKEIDPHDLITPQTWFPNEAAARGQVWNHFIDIVDQQSYQQITLDIEDINSVEDMELFFSLIYREDILYHPDSSFSLYCNSDFRGNTTVPTFSQEESQRLDALNDKCFDIGESQGICIYRLSTVVQRLVTGYPKSLDIFDK